MRKIHRISLLPLIFSTAVFSADAPTPPPAPSSEKIAATATPAATEWDVLKLEAGTWDADIEFPADKPDQPPTRMKGVQTNTFVVGDHWIKNEFDFDATYAGHGTWGYDPKKKKYVGIWVDTNQDYIRLDEGSYDAATHTMTWTSELRQPDPYPPAKYRMIEVFNGDSRILTMTAIGPKSGKEQLLGTITFHRRGHS